MSTKTTFTQEKLMTRSFLTLLMFVGMVGLSSTLSAQEKYAIQPRFEPGKYVQTLVMDNDMVMRVGNGDAEEGIPMKQEQKQKFLLEVSQPDDKGTQKVEMAFAEIKMFQAMMGMEIVYDSTDEDNQNPNLAPIYNAMLGSKFTFDLTKDGKSENFKGFDELWEKMIKSMPGGAGAVLEPMKEKMGDEMLSSLGSMDNNFGKEPRAIGEQWKETQSQTIPFLGESEIESTHTLKSVKDDIAVIATAGKIKMKGGDTIEIGPIKMDFQKGDMSITTTTSINTKTGLAVEAKSEIEMDMTAEMDVPINNSKMQMRITNKAVSTVTIEKAL